APPADDTPPATEPAAPANDGGLDDLFGGPEAAPADAAPADAAPAATPGDDPFGAPAMPAETPAAPADTPAAPADGGLDDLFGGPAADSAPASDPAPAAAASDSVDDLFGGAADTAPADPAPAADGGLDDLFGAPAGEEPAPADDAAPADDSEPADEPEPAGDSLDDLFGAAAPAVEPATDPTEPADEAPATDAVDDLFGAPASQPEESTSIDDLFGQHVEPSVESSVEELPAPLPPVNEMVANEVEAGLQIVTTPVLTSVDPLSDTRLRTWIDNTGQYRTDGRLIEINSDNVRLLKDTGRTCTVPNARMCPADAAYVDSLRKEIEMARLALLSSK
ncbi:MAG: cytoskeleton assembly control protein, partial [Pirellulaceae bacterium]|nr:cytoskeleton assembly control protein [Pirellulaceae bacterium]